MYTKEYSKYFNTLEYNFSDLMERVAKWNSLPNKGKHDRSLASINNQKRLVWEEAEELLTALKENNEVEMLDAWCDLFVVLSYFVFLNLPTDEINPDMLKDLNSLPTDKPLDNFIKELAAYSDVQALRDVCSAISLYKGEGYNALLEVLDSNDSKYPSIYEYPSSIYIESESKRIEQDSKGRYTGVSGSYYDGKVCFKDSNNKIMKPKEFKKPNLLPFINKGN